MVTGINRKFVGLNLILHSYFDIDYFDNLIDYICLIVIVSTISSLTNCDVVCISFCLRFLVPFQLSAGTTLFLLYEEFLDQFFE